MTWISLFLQVGIFFMVFSLSISLFGILKKLTVFIQ